MYVVETLEERRGTEFKPKWGFVFVLENNIFKDHDWTRNKILIFCIHLHFSLPCLFLDLLSVL